MPYQLRRRADHAPDGATADLPTPEAKGDALHDTLIGLGARSVMTPRDTRMYEDMRYACVDAPFGLRLEVFCPAP